MGSRSTSAAAFDNEGPLERVGGREQQRKRPLFVRIYFYLDAATLRSSCACGYGTAAAVPPAVNSPGGEGALAGGENEHLRAEREGRAANAAAATRGQFLIRQGALEGRKAGAPEHTTTG